MRLPHALGHQLRLPTIPSLTPIVFVVDEDLSVRLSLESLIWSQGWQSETFASAQEFLARPRATVPNCMILAVSHPNINSVKAQQQIACERNETPIIVVSSCEDIPTTVQAMKAGAVDVLVKPCRHDVLLAAIRQAIERSRIALDREMEMRELQNCYESLTRRERQVMALVVSGLLNKQVGGELGISEITVKAHRGQVMQKMKADSFAKLVIMATRLRPARFANTSSLLQEPVHSEVAS